MSWASRRRTTYATGVMLFFLLVIGGPIAYWYFTIPPTCTDGIQNQTETAVDRGGPCPLLDQRYLSPSAVLWARSFRVRDGAYNSMAYIQNPNDNAGVARVRYRFGLYDENNVLVAERMGSTFIMPGGITPVFEGAIETGHRIVAHTYFEFSEPLVWEHMKSAANAIRVNDKNIASADTAPRITATAENESVADLKNVRFMAAVFDPAGNAFASSQTAVERLDGGEKLPIIFSWPTAFNISVGSVDVIPVVAPVPVSAQ